MVPSNHYDIGRKAPLALYFTATAAAQFFPVYRGPDGAAGGRAWNDTVSRGLHDFETFGSGLTQLSDARDSELT